MKTDRKAALVFGYLGKLRTDIAHHPFPVLVAIWMKLEFNRNDNYMLDGIVEVTQPVGKCFIPLFVVGQGQLWHSFYMKPPYMQNLMPNRAFWEVSIGRCQDLNPMGVDDYCEFALTSSSPLILFRVKDNLDVYTRVFLNLTDELLDRLTKTGKKLLLHMRMMLDIARADCQNLNLMTRPSCTEQLERPASVTGAQGEGMQGGTLWVVLQAEPTG